MNKSYMERISSASPETLGRSGAAKLLTTMRQQMDIPALARAKTSEDVSALVEQAAVATLRAGHTIGIRHRSFGCKFRLYWVGALDGTDYTLDSATNLFDTDTAETTLTWGMDEARYLDSARHIYRVSAHIWLESNTTEAAVDAYADLHAAMMNLRRIENAMVSLMVGQDEIRVMHEPLSSLIDGASLNVRSTDAAVTVQAVEPHMIDGVPSVVWRGAFPLPAKTRLRLSIESDDEDNKSITFTQAEENYTFIWCSLQFDGIEF